MKGKPPPNDPITRHSHTYQGYPLTSTPPLGIHRLLRPTLGQPNPLLYRPHPFTVHSAAPESLQNPCPPNRHLPQLQTNCVGVGHQPPPTSGLAPASRPWPDPKSQDPIQSERGGERSSRQGPDPTRGGSKCSQPGGGQTGEVPSRPKPKPGGWGGAKCSQAEAKGAR